MSATISPPSNDQSFELLRQLSERVTEGDTLDELLTFIFNRFHHSIPYNRIGYALVDESRQRIITRWQKSDRPIKLGYGFAAPLFESSLPEILQTGESGIISDLVQFSEEHPRSEATRLLVKEGMRSSLTCPLLVHRQPIGCLFFASDQTGTYDDSHTLLFEEIAAHLALHIDRCQLTEQARLAREDAMAQSSRNAEAQQLSIDTAQQSNAFYEMQTALLPHEIPQVAGYRIAGGYRFSESVGGCFYDVLSLDNSQLGLFVADCTAYGTHGLTSMAILRTIMRSHNWDSMEPDDVLASVDKMCKQCFIQGTSASGLYAKFDPKSGTVSWSDAAHPAPLLVRQGGYVIEEPQSRHMQPLGLVSSEPLTSDSLPLGPGDKFVVYTKALVEATSAQGEAFGHKRLIKALSKAATSTASGLIDKLLTQFDEFFCDSILHDDALVLVIERTPENLEIRSEQTITPYPWRDHEVS